MHEPETKQQSTIWVFPYEPNPMKVVRSKKMVACVFFHSEHIATLSLEDLKTLIARWYTEICLPKVINETRKNNKNRRIILHHNNANSYTACETTNFLKDENIELMSHCLFSPNLSPKRIL